MTLPAAENESYPDTMNSLTSLRFFGAAAVFIYHLHLVMDVPRNAATLLLYKGYLGVDFFFILSGFILTHVYYRQVQARTFSARVFLVNRIARVYPLHVVTLAAAFVIGGLLHAKGWTIDLKPHSLITNLFLMQAWGFDNDFSFNAPSWSISAEWFAYLLFPELIFLAVRPRPLVTMIGALWFYGVMWYLTRKFLGMPFTNFSVPFSPLRIMPEFCFGMGLYLFGCGRARALHGSALILLCLAGLVILFYMRVPDPAVVLVLGLIIFIVAEGSRRRRPGILDEPVLVYLGEISYAIYMVHFLVLFGVWSFRGSPCFYGALAMSFPVTMALAALLHHAVELPCRRMIRSFSFSRQAAKSPK